MTPDKDLEEAAESAYKKINGDGITPIGTELFKAGAQWQQNRVLGLLRSKEAVDQEFYNTSKGVSYRAGGWALWLESKLTTGQKDGGE